VRYLSSSIPSMETADVCSYGIDFTHAAISAITISATLPGF
jgi:hypothetical protein